MCLCMQTTNLKITFTNGSNHYSDRIITVKQDNKTKPENQGRNSLFLF